ncbi:MAG TPA: tetratricopeptide repeat-containing protein [Solirubrobacteraceae bacterium]|nr:tetratricopeptide repeat-containing protein [Solirubrobacteraceae bacterium]
MPSDTHERVARRLQRLLAALGPSAVVGAAADGGDLLVLEAARGTARAPRLAIVLPTLRGDFRERSVEEDWRARHDTAIDRALEVGELTTLDMPDGTEAYRAANARILERAEQLAVEADRVVALIVASPGEGAMVEHLAARAAARGRPVIRIDPAAEISSRPYVFVAGPFGDKFDPQRKRMINCDPTYEKVLVPALENAQLRYRRADEQIDAGIVLQPMIEAISEADMVIADLATGNFNVGWELGLRHLLRSRHTLLIGPEGTRPPFDLGALRRVQYQQDQDGGISDAAALEAWTRLAPFLEQLQAPPPPGSDSPVAAVMDVTSWASLVRRGPPDDRFERLREQLALARDLRDAELTLQIVEGAGGLNEEQQMLIAAEAGVGLTRLGEYAEGARLLAPIVAADIAASRPDAHFYYAQALYKPRGAGVEAFNEAERVLRALLVRCPEHPEVWAALGAINKRRSHTREGLAARRQDIAGAMEAYAHDYERDLGAFYEGINFVACGLLLELVHADPAAGARARRALPAVAYAAELAAERDPRDFWAVVTVAEARVYEALLSANAEPDHVTEAYASAGRLRPTAGSVDSSLTQLRWLAEQGIEHPWLNRAGRELALAAGYPELADNI